jgi:periplasmic protein TonB
VARVSKPKKTASRAGAAPIARPAASAIARPIRAIAGFIPGATPAIVGASLLSVAAHGLILAVPGIVLPLHPPRVERSLEVVLVNSKSAEKPSEYKLLAQNNLDGGGNTDEENRRAQTPLPPVDARAASLKVQQARYEQRLAELESQARRLMTQIHSDKSVQTDDRGLAGAADPPPRLLRDRTLSEHRPAEQGRQPARGDRVAESARERSQGAASAHDARADVAQTEAGTEAGDTPPVARAEQAAQTPPLPQTTPPPSASEQATRAMNIARLEAVIAKNFDAYQSRPKRKFIGARTAEYRFARYVEEWRAKVERVGNQNYPEAAKQRDLHGSLQLTVAIKTDGQIESVEINKSSGHKILDAAAVHIVELAAPFAAFSSDMQKDTDVLHITRTWTFTRADQLTSE